MGKLIPSNHIEQNILLIRGQKVILDAVLARLYNVKTKELNKAVKRNKARFPEDFVFRLTHQETVFLRFQIGTSNMPLSGGRGGRRYLPHAFTEQGIAMLSGVLRSKRAVLVNVAIMRAFVRLRQLIASHKALAGKLAELERRMGSHDKAITSLFATIHEMMNPPLQKSRPIGFKRE